MKRLMPFLEAVCHEKLIWHWMQLLQKRIRNETSEIKCLQIRTMQSRILHYFLKSEILYGAGLDSAISIFLRGIADISTWSGLSSGDTNAILERAGRQLMLDMIKNPASISTELWASLCQTCSRRQNCTASYGIAPIWVYQARPRVPHRPRHSRDCET